MKHLSVIAVADYASGEEKSWEDLRRSLRAWADQEGGPPEEFTLVESARFQGRIPDDVLGLVPNMKVLYFDSESSYELKNRAVGVTDSTWVVLVDADCVPERSWLKVLCAAILGHPEAAAISSKTRYPGRSRLERILSLLSRSYLDPGRRGPTRFVSGNAACYRRDAFLRHPLPIDSGAFSGRLQSEALLRDGETLLFDPGLEVVHDFEGWPMERDLRRNHGYSTIITRLRDRRLPHARLIRAGVIAIPLILAGKILESMGDCLRCYDHYQVKAYELPLALALAVVTHVMEVPGMLSAYRGETVGPSAFR